MFLATLASAAWGQAPKVLPERPRVFWRAKTWDGPSVEKVKQWVGREEYQKRWSKLGMAETPPIGFAVAYLLKGDEAAARRAIDGLKKYRFDPKDSPSYTGIVAQRAAAVYDWLHDHPAFDAESRKAVAAELEKAAEAYYKSLKSGGPSTPFYSRVSGAIGGLTAVALALHGDSPKADEYVAFAAEYLKTKIGTIREMEDGATGGASYGLHHEFTDLANLVAAWRSATDWDAGKWIKESQGNWLQRQMLFQIWTTYPNGWFVKHGDIWGGSHSDKTQFSMHIGPISGMYRDGFGRTWADELYKRWGVADYHAEFVWEWFVFNDAELPARPLAELGRAEVFSPKLHGFVCWRDSWKPDATIVHFLCGETVDHHATYDQGKFLIFKQTPLAIKNGGYLGGYKGAMHMYFKSPWSANCVAFNGPKWSGLQPYIDFDGTPSWQEWKAARDKRFARPPTGVLLATEANDQFARALGDLTGSCPPGSSWKRELVFLGYKYLLVLDRVKAGPDIQHRWLLHTIKELKIDGPVATADNAPGRLFCRTLLPKDARLVNNSGEDKLYLHVDAKFQERQLVDAATGKTWDKFLPARNKPETQLGAGRLDVMPADPAGEAVYLHVLYPTDVATDQMPDCSVEQSAGQIVVKVGELTHTFKE